MLAARLDVANSTIRATRGQTPFVRVLRTTEAESNACCMKSVPSQESRVQSPSCRLLSRLLVSVLTACAGLSRPVLDARDTIFSFLHFSFLLPKEPPGRQQRPAGMVGGRETRLCVLMLFMMTLTSFICMVAADELPRSSNPLYVL